MKIQDAIASANTFNELCGVTSNAQVHISFFGYRSFTVEGNEGKLSIEKLDGRFLQVLRDNIHFNQEERCHGKCLRDRVIQLYEDANENIKSYNFLTRYFYSWNKNRLREITSLDLHAIYKGNVTRAFNPFSYSEFTAWLAEVYLSHFIEITTVNPVFQEFCAVDTYTGEQYRNVFGDHPSVKAFAHEERNYYLPEEPLSPKPEPKPVESFPSGSCRKVTFPEDTIPKIAKEKIPVELGLMGRYLKFSASLLYARQFEFEHQRH